jgi:hypothetical protein
VPALAADFTCQVYGGSFVLDDSDFKALDGTITREQFVSLEPTSNLRISICNTRKLWRLIKNGKAGVCDFTVHYKGYNALYFDDAETDKVMAAQTKAAAQGLADKLAGTPKKCQ